MATVVWLTNASNVSGLNVTFVDAPAPPPPPPDYPPPDAPPPAYVPADHFANAHTCLILALVWTAVCLAPSCLCNRHISLFRCKCLKEQDRPDEFFLFLLRDSICVLAGNGVVTVVSIFLIASNHHSPYGQDMLAGALGLYALLVLLSSIKMYKSRLARRLAPEPVVGQPVELMALGHDAQQSSAEPVVAGVAIGSTGPAHHVDALPSSPGTPPALPNN